MNILNQYIDLETNLGGVGQSNSWGGQTGPWGGRLPPPTGPNGASVNWLCSGSAGEGVT